MVLMKLVKQMSVHCVKNAVSFCYCEGMIINDEGKREKPENFQGMCFLS